MKKITVIITAILALACLILSGCGSSSSSQQSRPSVLNAKVDYFCNSSVTVELLRKDEDRVKRELTGKVLDVIGPVARTGKYKDSNDRFVEFECLVERDNQPACFVHAVMKNSNSQKLQALRAGDAAVIRGYGDVFYNKEKHNVYLFLDDAEVMNVYNRNTGRSRIDGSKIIDYGKDIKDLKIYIF